MTALTRRQAETLVALAAVFPDETQLVETGPQTHERLLDAATKAQPWVAHRSGSVVRMFGVPVVTNPSVPDSLLICTNSRREIIGVISIDLSPEHVPA